MSSLTRDPAAVPPAPQVRATRATVVLGCCFDVALLTFGGGFWLWSVPVLALLVFLAHGQLALVRESHR